MHSPGLGEFAVIVKVPYFLIIKSISDCCTSFPILGFLGISIHKIIVSIFWSDVIISQFYIPLHTIKDIHVWLWVDILHALFSPSWILKENLQYAKCLSNCPNILYIFEFFRILENQVENIMFCCRPTSGGIHIIHTCNPNLCWKKCF